MKEITYPTQGTCSRLMHVILSDDNIIQDVQVLGGCAGNLKGIISLVKGQKATDVIDRLRGIDCGGKGTSCPDQLAKALVKALETA